MNSPDNRYSYKFSLVLRMRVLLPEAQNDLSSAISLDANTVAYLSCILWFKSTFNNGVSLKAYRK